MTHPVRRRARSRADGLRAAAGLLAVAAGLALAAVAFGASPGVPATSSTPDGTDPTGQAVVEAGRGLYVANCAACHGPQGGGTAVAPTLIGVGAASADFNLRTGRMPLSAPGQRVVRQAPVFDEAGIEALVAYVASLGPGPDIPQVALGGDIHRGFELFQANCAACHAATGTGNAIGGGFVAVGLGNADPVTIGEATRIGPGAMPKFQFDDPQLADVNAYIRYLQDAPTPGGAAIGQTGPVAEGFVGVAIGLPALILVSMFVARHRRGAGNRPGSGGGRRSGGQNTSAAPEPSDPARTPGP